MLARSVGSPSPATCVTKRCKTLSGHNVVEGKDFKLCAEETHRPWCSRSVMASSNGKAKELELGAANSFYIRISVPTASHHPLCHKRCVCVGGGGWRGVGSCITEMIY